MAGRIRTIKPEWLENQRLGSCSDAARLLSIALILLADDHGRGRAATAYLAGQAWTYTLAKVPETLARVSAALSELVAIGYVRLYEVEGQEYFEILGWSRHQKVDKPGKPRVPDPTLGKIRDTLAKVPETLATDHDHDHDQGSRPGGEREGRRMLAAGPAASQPSGRVRSGSRKAKPSDPTPEESASIERIVGKLNERTGRDYEPTCKQTRKKLLGLLRDRPPGQTLERREGDIRLVIWRQADLWAEKGDMATFLRPKTLFGAENFANYVVEARAEWAKRQAARERTPPVAVLEVLAEAQAMAAEEGG
jgi:uncharacterized phage protein (TIGR02220 family)